MSTLLAVRLDVDGTLTDLGLPAGDGFVDALRQVVDGRVEIAHYARPDGSRRLALAVNAALQHPENLFATALVNAVCLKRLPYCLHGPAVILGALGGAGQHVDVPEPLRGHLPQIVDVLKVRYTPTTS